MSVDEMLEAARRRRKSWRVAELHELRLQYACLLADIAEHRWTVQEGNREAADLRLWDVLDREL